MAGNSFPDGPSLARGLQIISDERRRQRLIRENIDAGKKTNQHSKQDGRGPAASGDEYCLPGDEDEEDAEPIPRLGKSDNKSVTVVMTIADRSGDEDDENEEDENEKGKGKGNDENEENENEEDENNNRARVSPAAVAFSFLSKKNNRRHVPMMKTATRNIGSTASVANDR